MPRAGACVVGEGEKGAVPVLLPSSLPLLPANHAPPPHLLLSGTQGAVMFLTPAPPLCPSPSLPSPSPSPPPPPPSLPHLPLPGAQGAGPQLDRDGGDAAAGAPFHGSLCGERNEGGQGDGERQGKEGGGRPAAGSHFMAHSAVRRRGRGADEGGGRGAGEGMGR